MTSGIIHEDPATTQKEPAMRNDTRIEETDMVIERIRKEDPAADAHAIRLLAARIAAHAKRCDDPLMTITDLSKAMDFLHSAVQSIVTTTALDQLADPEASNNLQETLEHLAGAEAGLAELTGWY